MAQLLLWYTWYNGSLYVRMQAEQETLVRWWVVPVVLVLNLNVRYEKQK